MHQRSNVSRLLPIESPHQDMPPDERQERSGSPSLMPVAPTASSNPSSNISPSEIDWREPELSRSRVTSTWCFSMSLPRAKAFGGRASYDFTGLSSNCQYAYLYHTNRVSVFDLADPRAQCTDTALPRILVFDRDFTNTEPVFDVIMSEGFLIIITCQFVRVINVRDDYELEASRYGEWEPSGVACFENETNLKVALGQGQGNSLKSLKGQIVLFKYEMGTRPRKLSLCSTIKLPTGNRPKRISLDADVGILTCVTTIQNKIFVWYLEADFSTSGEPFDFLKNHYRVVGTHPASTFSAPFNTHEEANHSSTGKLRNRHLIHIPLHQPFPETLHPRRDISILRTPSQRRSMVL